jgi:hypothetical protein
MMFTCLTQFEIEEQQLELARSLEVPEEGENEQQSDGNEVITSISDDEEDEQESRQSIRDGKRQDEEDEQELRQSIRDGKRRKSVASEDKGDLSDDDGYLPHLSQIRHSGRVRKAPKTHKGFEIRMV